MQAQPEEQDDSPITEEVLEASTRMADQIFNEVVNAAQSKAGVDLAAVIHGLMVMCAAGLCRMDFTPGELAKDVVDAGMRELSVDEDDPIMNPKGSA